MWVVRRRLLHVLRGLHLPFGRPLARGGLLDGHVSRRRLGLRRRLLVQMLVVVRAQERVLCALCLHRPQLRALRPQLAHRVRASTCAAQLRERARQHQLTFR